jgi:diguanylate cyclase
MTTVSPKQQLMIAKQQLDKLSIFISGLADFFNGVSPAIDDEFQQIKKLLAGKPNYDKATELSVGLNARLKKESKYMQQKNADTLSQIQKSLRQLTDLNVVDAVVKKEIKSFIQTLVPSETKTASAPIAQFEVALGLFRKALANNVVVSKQEDEKDQQKLHADITRELKELIAPYYKQEISKNNKQSTKDKTITDVNQKLNAGLGNKELLECCLIMIRFVIKDVLTDASAATKLINDIHRSLGKINQGIKSTIVSSRKRLDKREIQSKAMQAQISEIEYSLSETQNVPDLKKHTTECLAKLQNSLAMNEQQDRVEQEKLITLLQSMQNRLDDLESQADGYKQKLLQQRINAMSDSLTKLPNRMAYEEKASAELVRSKQNKTPVFMAVIDIDNFKQINDKYGHSVGDKTLQVIASQLRKMLPKTDFLARWGGEEFIALLHDENIQQSVTKIEELRVNIAKLPFLFKGQRLSVTVSIGLTKFSSCANVNEAFDIADKLLYKAKENGRNQTCFEES